MYIPAQACHPFLLKVATRKWCKTMKFLCMLATFSVFSGTAGKHPQER
jgi:hypothetical protein